MHQHGSESSRTLPEWRLSQKEWGWGAGGAGVSAGRILTLLQTPHLLTMLEKQTTVAELVSEGKPRAAMQEGEMPANGIGLLALPSLDTDSLCSKLQQTRRVQCAGVKLKARRQAFHVAHKGLNGV